MGDDQEDDAQAAAGSKGQHTNAEMSIAGPLALWIGLVAIAAIAQLFIFPALQAKGISNNLMADLNSLAAYALYIPGVFVLPILAALWIGSRAGGTEGTHSIIAYRGMINAVYACIIYLIEIFVFYLIAGSLKMGTLAAIPTGVFIEYIVAVPIILCLVVAPLIAIVSAAKRY